MNKTDDLYKKEIAKEIKRIMQLKRNKEPYEKFQAVLKDLKPKSCTVKIGWRAGEEIDFLCAYEKGGSSKPFNLFVKNIENIGEIFGFICGLHPKIFHFNPEYSVGDETHYFVNFKLIRNG